MKRTLLIYLTILLALPAISFCGFYVAQAGASLFNESSEVILVRNGNHTTVTMANDFKGDVQDFAMVVPVPEVLDREDIRIVEREIFVKFDEYSGPRLVEYFDENPCEPIVLYEAEEMAMSSGPLDGAGYDEGVTVEAIYQVGEYNILILSATESQGLKSWLTRNDYQIPEGAEEVLEPYIKSDLKFFVVKVNLEEMDKTGYDYLRPLQIEYDSEEFMLPIRLGMANANGDQDLIIYALSQEGRIESTNYQTLEVPSNFNIPLFVRDTFDQFYVSLFNKAYQDNSKAVFVEYSWDLDSENYLKCDPCSGQPPALADLQEAGVDWLSSAEQGGFRGNNYDGKLHFTRLHVRYNRENFPQDLLFQETPNKDLFQARYVMNHPVDSDDLDCLEGISYLKKVEKRQNEELENLAQFTSMDLGEMSDITESYTATVKSENQKLWLMYGGLALFFIAIIAFGIRYFRGNN